MALLLWMKIKIALRVVDMQVKALLFFFAQPVLEYQLSDVYNAEIKTIIITAKSAVLWDRDLMGKVAAKIKIMPEGDFDLNKLKKEIQKFSFIQNIEEKPIAFGIKALITTGIIEDSEGGTDNIEKELSGVKGVQSVEVIDIELL